jgi:hypothetical protein
VIVHAGESPFKVVTAEEMSGVPEVSSKSIVISTPLDGAATPAVAREFRMFSTEVAVSEVQPSHALRKQLSPTSAGFQLSKNPAGNVVREEQPSHALWKYFPKFMSIVGREVSAVQFDHA